MNYDWFKLFNKIEFEADLIPSRTLVLQLEGRGRETFYLTRGNYTSVGYDDAFLPVSLLDQNPYVQGAYAVYLDGSDDVWFGFEVDE